MARLLVAMAVISFGATAASAQDPTITWDAGSPAAAPGPRVTASGVYTIPANAGNVQWQLNKIVVEIRLANTAPNGAWSSYMATVNQQAKTWSYIDGMPRPAGQYQIRARIETTKITTFPGPPPTSTSENINVEIGPVTKTL